MPTTFMITLGQKYARESHPTVPGGHPDGWLEVHGAVTEIQAREWVNRAIGSSWSFVYPESEFIGPEDENYPRGCIGIIDKHGLRTRDLPGPDVNLAVRIADAAAGLHTLACEKIPEGFYGTAAEFDAAKCGECPVCQLNDLLRSYRAMR